MLECARGSIGVGCWMAGRAANSLNRSPYDHQVSVVSGVEGVYGVGQSLCGNPGFHDKDSLPQRMIYSEKSINRDHESDKQCTKSYTHPEQTLFEESMAKLIRPTAQLE